MQTQVVRLCFPLGGSQLLRPTKTGYIYSSFLWPLKDKVFIHHWVSGTCPTVDAAVVDVFGDDRCIYCKNTKDAQSTQDCVSGVLPVLDLDRFDFSGRVHLCKRP